MKKFILIALAFTLSAATQAQVYYKKSSAPKAEYDPSMMRATPSITFEWEKADIKAVTMPSVFNELTYQGGHFVPQVNITTGLAQVWGAADVKMTITSNGDTIQEVKGMTYYGVAMSGGVSSLFGGGGTNPAFIVGGIVGIDNYAAMIGVDFMAKNPETGAVNPAFMVGFTLNIRELPFLKNSTTITMRNVNP